MIHLFVDCCSEQRGRVHGVIRLNINSFGQERFDYRHLVVGGSVSVGGSLEMTVKRLPCSGAF